MRLQVGIAYQCSFTLRRKALFIGFISEMSHLTEAHIIADILSEVCTTPSPADDSIGMPHHTNKNWFTCQHCMAIVKLAMKKLYEYTFSEISTTPGKTSPVLTGQCKKRALLLILKKADSLTVYVCLLFCRHYWGHVQRKQQLCWGNR